MYFVDDFGRRRYGMVLTLWRLVMHSVQRRHTVISGSGWGAHGESRQAAVPVEEARGNWRRSEPATGGRRPKSPCTVTGTPGNRTTRVALRTACRQCGCLRGVGTTRRVAHRWRATPVRHHLPANRHHITLWCQWQIGNSGTCTRSIDGTVYKQGG